MVAGLAQGNAPRTTLTYEKPQSKSMQQYSGSSVIITQDQD